MRKKFTIYHILFCIFLTGGSLTFSQEDTISTKHKPIRNPIIDYNNNLKDIFKEESLRQVNLTGAPVSVVEADGSVKYLEEKTLMILDEQLGKTIISNLFLDESLFKVNEDGTISGYSCACMPDVTITIICRFGKTFKIQYFDSGEIKSTILHSQRSLEKEKAEQLNRIFTEFGLINKNNR